MKKKRRERGEYTDGQIATAHAVSALVVIIVAIVVILILSSCGGKKTLTRGYTANIRQGVEVTIDSTYHPYSYKISRYFHIPSGEVEREVLEGSGEVMRVTRSERDTVEVVVRDTIVEIREKPVYLGAGAVAGGNRNWYWWLLSGVAVTVIVWGVLKLRRYGWR